MNELLQLVERISQSCSNVLVTGESGTGKELVARAIHERGPRSKRPFVAINCSAIPENLLESELFGHARGSFTGAVSKKRGLFEEAEDGTIFLDEIGDMPISLQAKILRVLQERKVRPVGDNHLTPVHARVIAATNRELKRDIREHKFREDLYYRLNVIHVPIPSLRDRREDIPLLAQYFVEKYAPQNGGKVISLTPEAIRKLQGHPWHGNIRELENVVERAIVLCRSTHIDLCDLPPEENDLDTVNENEFIADFPTLGQLEKRYIKLVLERTRGKKESAAQMLGISRRTLYRKEREFGWVCDPE